MSSIKYPDVSSAQHGIDLTGAELVCIKATEGETYVNPDYEPMVLECEHKSIPYFAYHFLHYNEPGQAEHCYSIVGARIPLMLDWESTRASHPTVADAVQFIDEYRSLGGVCHVLYLPHWYWSEIGTPDLKQFSERRMVLVSSDYVPYTEDKETGAGWQPYGGMTPEIWQYTDQEHFGGSVVDFNGFVGTMRELTSLIATGMPPVDKSPGWHEYNTDGTKSLSEIAGGLKAGPTRLLQDTALHFGDIDDTVATYVNNVFSGHLTHEAPIPSGGVLWVFS